jgi:hypothetical protein
MNQSKKSQLIAPVNRLTSLQPPVRSGMPQPLTEEALHKVGGRGSYGTPKPNPKKKP